MLQDLRRHLRRLEKKRQAMTTEAKRPDRLLDWVGTFLPAVLTCQPSAFHCWLCNELDRVRSRENRGARLNILAPRGAAKSTYASLAYPLREALEGREPFTVIVSDTSGQAKDYLRQIRAQIEANERLGLAYSAQVRQGTVWRDDRIQLANGCEIMALGTGGKIRGRKSAANRRPTLIIADDIQNKDHINSSMQRQRSWEWLTKDLLSAGEPDTNVVVLGTALHRDCIVCRLQGPDGAGWQSTVFRSVIEWPKRLDLWREWEGILFNYEDDRRTEAARAFYEQHREEMDL